MFISTVCTTPPPPHTHTHTPGIYSVKEPDFFAGMVPTLANSTQHTGDEDSSNVGAKLDSNKSSTHSEESVSPGLASALEYQPQNEVCGVGGNV